MKFGLMFFAASEDALGPDKYRLVLEGARFADRERFSSVWVPERHFTGLGGLYPNPAVLHAGLATCTHHVRLNAGSIVAPLHHPVRIAEEWSVVDNLSNGRVGLSFASGWNPDDFVFFPDRYARRHEQVIDTMQAVQRLWRGEAFAGTNGVGQPASVTIFPRPVQRELPVWMTVAGNPAHFARAGASGANLLTHLLDQDEAVLASRISLYREARAAAGFERATGIVSLMIHTFVGGDAALVREQARRPYCDYLKANIGLFKGLAQSRGHEVDLSSMSPAALDELVNFLYDRFAASRGLIGTPDSCASLVSRLEQLGVDELACLLDFGPDVDLVLGNLPHLARLKDRHAAAAAPLRWPAESPAPFDRHAACARCPEVMSGGEFHRRLRAHGMEIGGGFQPVKSVWRRDGEAIAELQLEPASGGYHVHPAALDACGRILAAALPEFGREDGTSCVPTGFDSCDFQAPLSGSVWVHAAIIGQSNGPAPTVTGDVEVYDESGRLLARLGGLRLRPIDHTAAAPDAGHLLYERTWQPAAANLASATDARGRWMVIADDGDVALPLTRLLEENGGECRDLADGAPLRGIVYLRGLDAVNGSQSRDGVLQRDVQHAVEQALTTAQSSGSTPIFIVTRGAVPVSPQAVAISLPQTPLWGLGRALAVERPGALGALIDLDPAGSVVDGAQHLLQVLTGDRGEDMVAFRSGVRYVPRLRRIESIRARQVPLTFGADDTVLVSGGTGGLGLRLAHGLAARGARRLLLCSRRPPPAAAEAQLQRLRAAGVEVAIVRADVADHAALKAQFDLAMVGRPPLTSVFHLAGVLDDGQLGEQTWERFAGVFAAKVAGAWNLHRLTQGMPLEHFVLFSSLSSLLPAPGQSSYAAANAFLDGLAHHRRSQGLPALAVNWGPWSDAGHAQTDYGRQAHERLASIGIGSIDPALGLRLLDTLLQEQRTQAAAVAVDWPRLFRADPAASRLGLLADLGAGFDIAASRRRREPAALVDALAALPPEQRRPHLLQSLSDMVIAALKLATDEPLDARQRLFDIGLDSMIALEVKDRLELALGVPLSATLLFVRPTLDALSDYILTDIVPDTTPAATMPAVRSPAAEPSSPAMSEDELTLLLLREIDASRGA